MRSVEEILIQEAGVPADALAKARERLKPDKDLGDALRELGALDANGWAKVQAAYYGLSYRETLPWDGKNTELLARVPLAFAKQYHLLPLALTDEALTVAIANPREIAALDDLRLLFGRPVQPFVVPKPVLLNALNHAYDQASQSTQDLLDTLDEKILDLDASDRCARSDLNTESSRGGFERARQCRRSADHGPS